MQPSLQFVLLRAAACHLRRFALPLLSPCLRSTCSMLAIRQSLARRSLAPSARALSAAAVEEPLAKPDSPNFSSGPCAKRPGWSPAIYGSAPVGRSHRSSIGKARLKEAIEKTRSVLGVPDDYRIGVVPASDTGAIEMAMWLSLIHI